MFWPTPGRAASVFDDVVAVHRGGLLGRIDSGAGVHPEQADLALRAQRVGLAEITPAGAVLTDFGQALVGGGGRDLRCYFEFVDEVFRPCYAHAPQRMRLGTNCFVAQYGCGYFEYLDRHPSLRRLAHQAMLATQSLCEARLAQTLDLGQARSIVDVGGGAGGLAGAIAQRYPDCSVTVADIDPQAPELFGSHGLDGVLHLRADFFDAVPQGADVYVLKLILHDWEEADALRILRVLARAMTAASRLVVIESPLPAIGSPDVVALWDVHQMFTMGGRERTPAEIQALASQAGLELQALHSGPDPMAALWFKKAASRSTERLELHRAGMPDSATHASLGLAIDAAHRLWTDAVRAGVLGLQGATSVTEIATCIDAEASATARLLRAWACMELVHEEADGSYRMPAVQKCDGVETA